MAWWTIPIAATKFAYDIVSETKEAKAPEKKKPKTNKWGVIERGKRLKKYNHKSVKEYFNNRKKYQQPRKAQKSMGDLT
jgi:hypothetical protein